jgi:hypothetical protein
LISGSRQGSGRVWVLGVAVACGLVLASSGSGSASARTAAAQARSVRLAVVAHLHYVSSRGSYLFEEGVASGALAGLVRARLRVTAGISGSFTFYPRGGSLSGSGSGTLHESGRYASFGGSLQIIGGTGRYAHARGAGGLYGVYDRQNLGVTIQTTGSLSY